MYTMLIIAHVNILPSWQAMFGMWKAVTEANCPV
jgi:hypothetical protein